MQAFFHLIETSTSYRTRTEKNNLGLKCHAHLYKAKPTGGNSWMRLKKFLRILYIHRIKKPTGTFNIPDLQYKYLSCARQLRAVFHDLRPIINNG